MYCPQEQFEARFGADELAQVLQTNGGLTFDEAAADADATIDSYLAAIPGRTFTLPLTAPPARIVGVAADLTRYELWAAQAGDEVKRRRDEAIEWLRDLVAGKAMLLVAAESPIEDVPTPAPAYRTNGRTFTDASLARFIGPDLACDERGGLHGCD